MSKRKRRPSTGNGLLVVGRGGGGAYSMEQITWKDTLKSLVVFCLVLILFRLWWVVLGCVLLMCIGEQAGGIIAFSIAAYMCWMVYTNQYKHNKHLPAFLGISVLLIFLGVFDYWPDLLRWSWQEHQMYWRVTEVRIWGMGWNDTGWVAAESTAVILRVLAGILFPSLVWVPANLLDWAMRMEMWMPLFREGTKTTPATPESIPEVVGMKLKESHRSASTVVQNEDDVLVVPGLRVRGTGTD